MPKTFSVKIPVPAYIAKFLHVRYGNPIQINNKNIIGTVIKATLEKKMAYSNLSIVNKEIKLRSFDDFIECVMPISAIYNFGMEVSNDKSIILNRFFEEHFDESFYTFIQCNIDKNKRYCGLENSINIFTDIYGIVIDEDITIDCLKKREYRHRQKISGILINRLSSRQISTQNTQQTLFLV